MSTENAQPDILTSEPETSKFSIISIVLLAVVLLLIVAIVIIILKKPKDDTMLEKVRDQYQEAKKELKHIQSKYSEALGRTKILEETNVSILDENERLKEQNVPKIEPVKSANFSENRAKKFEISNQYLEPEGTIVEENQSEDIDISSAIN